MVTPAMIKELRERTGVGMGKCKEALTEAKGDMELAISNLRKAGMASAVKKEGRETKEGVIKSAESDKALALLEVMAETDFVVKNERFQEFATDLAQEAANTEPANATDFAGQKFSKDPEVTIDQLRSVTIQTLGENIQLRRLELFPKKADHSIGVYTHLGGKLVTLVEISGAADEADFAREIAMHIAAEAPEYLSSDEIPERVISHEKEIAAAQIQNKPDNIKDKIIEGKLRAYYDQVCLLNQKFVKDPSTTIAQLVENRGKEKGTSLKVTQFLRWHVGE